MDDVEEKLDNAAVDVEDGTAAPDKNWDEPAKWPDMNGKPKDKPEVKPEEPAKWPDMNGKPKPKKVKPKQEPSDATADKKTPGTWKEFLWRHRYGLGIAGGLVGGAYELNRTGPIRVPPAGQISAPPHDPADDAREEMQRIRDRLEQFRINRSNGSAPRRRAQTPANFNNR